VADTVWLIDCAGNFNIIKTHLDLFLCSAEV
jgi:hypothetical protein